MLRRAGDHLYNGEKIRVAFALDCCDREAMRHVATTGGITAEDVQQLMVATVEHRYGWVNRVPQPIEWLTDNGSCYTARNTNAFAWDIGLIPRTTPVSSPQSNGMAEAFVRTLRRDYVRVNPRPNAQSVIDQLHGWFAHYDEVLPPRALRYRSPREFILQTCEALSGPYGATTMLSARVERQDAFADAGLFRLKTISQPHSDPELGSEHAGSEWCGG